MSWLTLTLLSVFIYSFSNTLHGVLMKDEQSDPYAQSVVFFGLAGTLALIFSLFHGGFQYKITFNQFLLFIPLTICCTVGPVLLFKSFKLIDASENAVIQSSQKLWTVLGAFIFLHEVFTINKMVGTLVIIFGIIVAIWENKKIKINKGVTLVFIASLFYATMDLISYYIVRDFDPFSFTAYVCFLPVVTLLIIRPKTIKKIKYYFKSKYALFVCLLGLGDTLGTICSFYAYQIGRNVSQITPIMGLITVFSVLISITLLKERTRMFQKIAGAVIVVTGVLLVL